MISIKSMGFNFLRLAHYPQRRIVLDACDELGIVAWEELPWSRGGVGGEVWKKEAEKQLIEMIVWHYNHPSIIFWGLGNEVITATFYGEVSPLFFSSSCSKLRGGRG